MLFLSEARLALRRSELARERCLPAAAVCQVDPDPSPQPSAARPALKGGGLSGMLWKFGVNLYERTLSANRAQGALTRPCHRGVRCGRQIQSRTESAPTPAGKPPRRMVLSEAIPITAAAWVSQAQPIR